MLSLYLGPEMDSELRSTITNDGAFYTFVLTALAAGSGSISIGFFNPFAYDNVGSPVDIDSVGTPLSYNRVEP